MSSGSANRTRGRSRDHRSSSRHRCGPYAARAAVRCRRRRARPRSPPARLGPCPQPNPVARTARLGRSPLPAKRPAVESRLVQVPPPGSASASGLAVVREATRHSHGQLEAGFAARPWDAVQHAHLLERLLGVHLPLEAALDRLWLAGGLEVSWPPRRRAHLIRADLRAIGRTPAQVAAIPPLSRRARCRPRRRRRGASSTCWTAPRSAERSSAGPRSRRASRRRRAARSGASPGRRPAGARQPGPSTPCRPSAADECARWAAATFEAVGHWLAAPRPAAGAARRARRKGGS